MDYLLFNIGVILVLFIFYGLIYTLGYVFYNLFLHPLRRYPGPLLMRATRATYCYKLVMGTLPFEVLDLHKHYGEVVRIAPDELSFANPQAWTDIMGHRARGLPEFEKSDNFYRPLSSTPRDIISAQREEHGLLRRQLAHGFSEKSLRGQEPIIKHYIDLLIRRLQDGCGAGEKALNLVAWYNYTTFDIIGDLAFGEPFGCLDSSDYHPWVRMIFEVARVGTLLQTANFFPFLKKILFAMAPKSAVEQRENHHQLTKMKLIKRMEMPGERIDLIEGLLKNKEEWVNNAPKEAKVHKKLTIFQGLTLDKLQANSSILIIGGSETTATLLSGVTFLLLTNPDALNKVTEEVRSAFASEDEITFTSVGNLSYMLACLNEALRMCPPGPGGLPRVVPDGGATICGHYVPEKTTVAVHQWALYHNSNMFSDPFNFHPERHMCDERSASDSKDALQPFHLGPRNCLGRHLAYVEMRTILARVLWNFDMRIAEDSRDWLSRQKVYLPWQKGALNAYLTPVQRR
ncbi:cytochrome P450 [Whalleya microplaca]|nr:cytochrome P450 [Whalleya microplaca]